MIVQLDAGLSVGFRDRLPIRRETGGQTDLRLLRLALLIHAGLQEFQALLNGEDNLPGSGETELVRFGSVLRVRFDLAEFNRHAVLLVHAQREHGTNREYRQVRNRRVTGALVQGVETARAVLTTTPQGQAADAQFVKWLMEHQKEAGIFTTVSALVDQLSDNPAAKMTAQEIAERVRKAQVQPAGAVSTAAA